ncbi:MAG TPA: hypothetical protein VGJ36_04080 [Gemmatimonadales bacterium]
MPVPGDSAGGGLIFQGYPGNHRSAKEVQASSGLRYDVFARYDPENLLLFQAHRECWRDSWSGTA